MSPQFDSFRRRTTAETNSDSSITAEFILKSSSSTTITHSRLNKNVTAVITRDHKEGADEIILFSTYNNVVSNNIKTGDFIVHDNKSYFAYIEYQLPEKVKRVYVKHKLLECNVIIKFDNFSQPATFIGSLKKFISTSSEDITTGVAMALEQYKPIVVTTDAADFKVGTRFLLGTEAFVVTAIDRLSNPGIVYMSVNATPYNAFLDDRDEGIAITPSDPEDTEVPEDGLKEGQQVTVATNFGYFYSDPVVEILSRTSTQVIFICPYGINELTVKVKDSGGVIVTVNYQVVI